LEGKKKKKRSDENESKIIYELQLFMVEYVQMKC